MSNSGNTSAAKGGAVSVDAALLEDLGMAVVVGLKNGDSKSGSIGWFEPAEPDLILQSVGRPGSAAPAAIRIAAEDIAYIGFARTEGPQEEPIGPSIRVQVTGGRTFSVVPSDMGGESRLGFYGHPSDPQSPFSVVFFYNRGVIAKDNGAPAKPAANDPKGAAAGAGAKEPEVKKIPIGQLLDEQKVLAPDNAQHAAELQRRRRMRIGEILVQEKLVSQKDIDLALAEQKLRKGKKLGEILIEMKMVSEENFARALARKFNIPFVDLDKCELDPAVIKELPVDLMEKYRVVPLQIAEQNATVALADPLAVDIIDALRFALRRHITEVLAVRSQLERYVGKFVGELKRSDDTGKMGSILKELTAEDAISVETDAAKDAKEEPLVGESDSAVIRLANQIIIEAYRRGVSDIHIEPNGKEQPTTVRFRIDGDCEDYQEIPPAFRLPLVARLKIMAGLDISERRKPQDGKIRLKLPERNLELRMATIPTVNGNEDIVLRILAASKPMPLEKMALSKNNLVNLKAASEKPYGLMLCVGPTGSGKTTTLHSVLGYINTKDRKIWTAEDPVEITQARLRQVQVNPKIGFTFATAMRAFLRADPDVIMIGEMRDQETAGIAVEASLTGHLVLSTLHTNSAPETITRLVDMGLDPFSFADALLGILAQRLARSLCPSCREAYRPTPDEYAQFAAAASPEVLQEAGITENDCMLWRGRGCKDCRNSGYAGRVGLHELLIANEELKVAIQRKAAVAELREIAIKAGMRTLVQDGAIKCTEGRTDLQQVLAVCSR